MLRLLTVNPNIEDYPKGFQGYWTVHNKRYDLTDFIKHHPGGRSAILQGRGRNCTEIFESYHALVEKDVHQILAKYYVEDTPEGDPDYDASYDWNPDSPGGRFWADLKSRVKVYFIKNRLPRQATSNQLAVLIAGTVLTLACLPAYYRGDWWTLIAIPLLYWVAGAVGMHDGNHFSISKKEWLNDVFTWFAGGICSPFWWKLSHNFGHHEHTNVKGKDGTLFVVAAYITSVALRKKFLYIIPALHSLFLAYFSEIQYHLLTPRNEMKELRAFSRADKLIHYITRLLFFCAFIVAPFKLFSFPKAFAFAFVPYLIHGLIFHTLAQISHLSEICFQEHEFLEVEPQQRIEGEKKLPMKDRHWAVHQVNHTLDWGFPSDYNSFWSIGLCFQTVHHLFPSVYSAHLPAIQPIVVQTCKDHGVKYNWVPTLDDGIRAHSGLLRRYKCSSIVELFVQYPTPIFGILKTIPKFFGNAQRTEKDSDEGVS